jgi:hypothetical protein
LRFFPFFCVSLSNCYKVVFGFFCPVWPVSVSGPVSGRSYLFIVYALPPLPVVGVCPSRGVSLCLRARLSISAGLLFCFSCCPCLSVARCRSVSRRRVRCLNQGGKPRAGRFQIRKPSNKCFEQVFRTNFRNKCSRSFLALSEKISNRIFTESDRISEFFQPNPDRISDRI